MPYQPYYRRAVAHPITNHESASYPYSIPSMDSPDPYRELAQGDPSFFCAPAALQTTILSNDPIKPLPYPLSTQGSLDYWQSPSGAIECGTQPTYLASDQYMHYTPGLTAWQQAIQGPSNLSSGAGLTNDRVGTGDFCFAAADQPGFAMAGSSQYYDGNTSNGPDTLGDSPYFLDGAAIWNAGSINNTHTAGNHYSYQIPSNSHRPSPSTASGTAFSEDTQPSQWAAHGTLDGGITDSAGFHDANQDIPFTWDDVRAMRDVTDSVNQGLQLDLCDDSPWDAIDGRVGKDVLEPNSLSSALQLPLSLPAPHGLRPESSSESTIPPSLSRVPPLSSTASRTTSISKDDKRAALLGRKRQNTAARAVELSAAWPQDQPRYSEVIEEREVKNAKAIMEVKSYKYWRCNYPGCTTKMKKERDVKRHSEIRAHGGQGVICTLCANRDGVPLYQRSRKDSLLNHVLFDCKGSPEGREDWLKSNKSNYSLQDVVHLRAKKR